jgi:hypothetical protein
MVLSQPARTSTGGVEAPWRGDGHSGQQLPYESRAPRRVVAFTSSLCSDSPGSVRACRQAFAGDPARIPNSHLCFSLRVFARGPRCANPLPAEAISSQPVAEGRSRAGKPELRSFVPIRVHSWFNVTPAFPFASSRGTNSPPPSPRSCSPQAASCRGQISGWKARATFILVHSCPFVVQRHPCVCFASSRLRVRPAACKTPSPQRQSAVSRSQRADLGLESPSYVHSCPFVSIRGSTSPLRFLRVFA